MKFRPVFILYLLIILGNFQLYAPTQTTNNNSNDNALHSQLLTAIRTDNKQVIEKTVSLYKQKGVGLDAYRDATRTTPLMYAALLGKKDVVDYLLAHGANPEAEDLVSQTPIHYAKKGLIDAQRKHDTQKINEFKDTITLLQHAKIK